MRSTAAAANIPFRLEAARSWAADGGRAQDRDVPSFNVDLSSRRRVRFFVVRGNRFIHHICMHVDISPLNVINRTISCVRQFCFTRKLVALQLLLVWLLSFGELEYQLQK